MEAIPVHGAEAGQVDGLKKKKKKKKKEELRMASVTVTIHYKMS